MSLGSLYNLRMIKTKKKEIKKKMQQLQSEKQKIKINKIAIPQVQFMKFLKRYRFL